MWWQNYTVNEILMKCHITCNFQRFKYLKSEKFIKREFRYMYTQFNFSLPVNIDLRSKLKISTNVTRKSHAIRRGIKPREAFRARTSRLISAANFIFGASRANDSASSVSPQCSRGGPDSDTRSQRKSIKPARKSALDRERAPCRAERQSRRRSWNWHFDWTRQKLRSLEDTHRCWNAFFSVDISLQMQISG